MEESVFNGIFLVGDIVAINTEVGCNECEEEGWPEGTISNWCQYGREGVIIDICGDGDKGSDITVSKKEGENSHNIPYCCSYFWEEIRFLSRPSCEKRCDHY